MKLVLNYLSISHYRLYITGKSILILYHLLSEEILAKPALSFTIFSMAKVYMGFTWQVLSEPVVLLKISLEKKNKLEIYLE